MQREIQFRTPPRALPVCKQAVKPRKPVHRTSGLASHFPRDWAEFVQPTLTLLTGGIVPSASARLGIMRGMPSQPTLFQADPPAGPGGDRPPTDPGRGPPPPRVAAMRSGRPWWATLAGWVLQPWIGLKIEPQAPPE